MCSSDLFEAAARLGGVLGGAPRSLEDELADYGRHVGTAFQLIDDVLDYSGDATAIGKSLGDDLKIGAPLVSGAKVKATVVAHGRGEKLKIFKLRRRKHYQKTQGHRQSYTEVRIDDILQG